MKKIILVAMVIAAMLSTTALADDIILVDDDIYKVVLHDIEATVDYANRPAVALDMTATVKKGPTSPMAIVAYRLTAYQNNKSIDTAIHGTDSAFTDISGNIVTKLKNGASEEFSVYYSLEDDSDIEFEFTRYGEDPLILYYSPDTDTITTDAPAEEPLPDYRAMYEELSIKYNELLEKYNELLEN